MTEIIVLYIMTDVYEFVYDLLCLWLNVATQNEHFMTCFGFITCNIVLLSKRKRKQ